MLGIVMMMVFTTVVGIYINEMSLRGRSSILVDFFHGAITGQAYGVRRPLFPKIHPLLGGVAGVVRLVVWRVLGQWEARKPVLQRIPDQNGGDIWFNQDAASHQRPIQ